MHVGVCGEGKGKQTREDMNGGGDRFNECFIEGVS